MQKDAQMDGAAAGVPAGPIRSGALARLAGVSTDTLRHYERLGVLSAPWRAANGYREYPPQALERLRLVRRALRVGFTLAELARVLQRRDQGGSPCREVRTLAEGKLGRMERELSELTARRDALRGTLEEWEHRLAGRAPGKQARLLDHIHAIVPAGGGGGWRPPRDGFRPKPGVRTRHGVAAPKPTPSS